MSLLVADGVQLFYANRAILDGASFRIAAGDRIGLIGPNGTGKSTLLRVLAGEKGIDRGSLTRANGLTVGYLAQDVLEVGDGPLLETVLRSVPGREEISRRIEGLEEALVVAEDPETQTELGCRLADLHHDLLDFETTYSRQKAERILAGLKFTARDFERPLSQLSGGWRMRAALGALLFRNPDLLLLDEPTNHLDLPSVTWLADFLRGFPHALVLICHDREFLDRQVDRILSFEPEGLRAYKGNYTAYREQREEEDRVLEASARNQDRERKRLERFIEKSRSRADKARLVQSRVKKLERLEDERVETREQGARIRVRFPPVERAGGQVLRLEGVGKAFGANVLYRDLAASVPRGERVAVAGVNGAGKTTLLRILAGELAPDAGSVVLGANVKRSYYAQHLSDALDARRTILDEVSAVVPEMGQTAVRGLLGAFLFRGDDVEKSIGVLSGGERARVALAKILVRPGNVLLLDEPTNHLDTESAEVLAESLAGYDGTIVFVSHNLSFARKLATHVWEIEDGRVHVYPGTLDEYLDSKARAEAAPPASPPKPRSAPAPAAGRPAASTPAPPAAAPARARAPAPPAPVDGKAARKAEAKQREALARRRKALAATCADLEKQIAALEAEQKDLEGTLAEPRNYQDPERFPRLLATFDVNRTDFAGLYGRWEATHAELEAAAEPAEPARA